MAVGRVVLVAGILVLLFIPYLLWGTGLMTARSQADLRSQFVVDQHLAGSAPTKRPTPGAATGAPEVAPTIAPPAIGGPVGIISIPRIGLSMMVVEGTDEIRLQAGPGHYPGTPLPGEAGNAAIAGHRTTYLAPFYHLDALVPGDQIGLTTVQGNFVYSVTGSEVVDPSDVAVVAATSTAAVDLDNVQSAFQRQPTAGGSRGIGGQRTRPPQRRANHPHDARTGHSPDSPVSFLQELERCDPVGIGSGGTDHGPVAGCSQDTGREARLGGNHRCGGLVGGRLLLLRRSGAAAARQLLIAVSRPAGSPSEGMQSVAQASV